jgi:hypothetical protein
MGRRQLVTVDKVVEAVKTADRPFATVKDIAESLDVRAETVRNHQEDIHQSDELAVGKVDRATVYWIAEREEPPEEVNSGGGKGILNRLFDGLPALSASTGLLAVWTALVGLSVGVGLSTLLFEPPVGVALLAVWGLLVAALGSLAVAVVHELQTSKQPTLGADTA